MVTLSLTAEQIDQLRNIAAVGGKWLIAAFASLGGLAGIAKIITTFVARKKPVKLNQSDYEAIANAVSDFKTISTSARDELKASMNDLADGENGLVAVETPKVDKPIVKIEKVAENENKPLY